MGARHETTESRIADGKATQARMISMLHAWYAKNGIAGRDNRHSHCNHRNTNERKDGRKRRFPGLRIKYNV